MGESATLALHLERLVPAPPPLVFRMLVEPDLLAQWWGPKGFSVPRIDLDLRVGGRYRIVMQPPEGDLFFLSGEFRDVEAATRLTYTFCWEPPDPDDQETVVSLSLRDRRGSTVLTVDQAPFATESRLVLHEEGWTESLERLEQLLGNREPNRG